MNIDQLVNSLSVQERERKALLEQACAEYQGRHQPEESEIETILDKLVEKGAETCRVTTNFYEHELRSLYSFVESEFVKKRRGKPAKLQGLDLFIFLISFLKHFPKLIS